MDKAIRKAGLGGVSAGLGISKFNLALGAVAVGAIAVVAAVGAIATAIVKIGTSSIRTATDVESAFAGILKTTNNLGTNLFDLTAQGEEVFQQFRDLTKEIPLSFKELAEIGAFAGQLGIAEDQLADFTATVAALKVSTNLTTEEAAISLARLGQIYGITTENMAMNTEQLGSAIVFMGNNFRASEKEILLMTRNIAGAGAIADISQAAIIGIATATTEAGVRAEAGGTAIQNAILKINEAVVVGGEELDILAEITGTTVEEFAELWETDATKAFTSFVQGLSDSGDQASLILDDLGLGSARSQRTFLALAQSPERLVEAIDASSAAFEDNTALVREAEIFYETFESKVAILKNQFRDLGLTIGLQLLPFLADIVENLGPIIDAFSTGLGPAMQEIGDAISNSLLPAFSDLAETLGLDFTLEGITQSVEDFGAAVANNIEDISAFVTNVSELIGAFQEGGTVGLLEALGLTESDIQLISDVALALGSIAASILIVQGAIGAGTAIAGFFATLSSAGGILAVLSTLFFALNLPILILIGAIAGLVFLIVKFGAQAKETFLNLLEQVGIIFGLIGERIAEKWEEIVDNTKVILANLKDTAIQKFQEVRDGIVAFFSELESTWSENWENLKLIVSTVWDNIKTTVSEKFAEIRDSIKEWIGRILVTFGITDQIKDQWRAMWEDVKLIGQTIWNNIVESLNETWTIIKDTSSETWDTIKDALQTTWDTIKDAATTTWEAITENILAPLVGIGIKLSEKWDEIKVAIAKKWDEIKEAIGLKIEEFSTFISEKITGPILEAINAAWDAVKIAVTEKWDEIKEALRLKLEEFAPVIEEKVVEWVTAISTGLNGFIQAGKDIMAGLLQGLIDGSKSIIDFITGLAEEIIASIKDAVGAESPATEFIKIGNNILEGLTLGMEQLAFEPVDAIINAGDQIINAGRQILPSTNGNNSNIDRSRTTTVNANYFETQSPNTIATDLALAEALG